MKKRITFVALLIIVSMVMSGCMLPIFGNEPPEITSSPSLTVKAGDTYSYQVVATDDNNADLTYSLLTAPDGMSINTSTGLITWIPTESQVGENEVQLEVSDGWSGSTQEFSVLVSIVKLSSISVLPETMSIVRVNTQAISSITAYYDNGSSEAIDKPDCSYQSSNDAIASVSTIGLVTGKIAGSAIITVSYSEGEITKSDTVSVTVTNPAPTPPSGGG